MTELLAIQSDTDIRKLALLAHDIWNEYFPAIISQDQVDYMVGKFQSEDAIRAQLEQGYLYYFIWHNNSITGYTGLYPDTADRSMHLSKFYLHKEYRSQGVGTAAMILIADLARTYTLDKIRLTVNRYNTPSINAYEHMGFSNTGTLVQDIGNGFMMDDYVMVKWLHPAQDGSPDKPD